MHKAFTVQSVYVPKQHGTHIVSNYVSPAKNSLPCRRVLRQHADRVWGFLAEVSLKQTCERLAMTSLVVYRFVGRM